MPLVLAPIAYELALLAGAGIALLLASPPGQQATRQAARSTIEALDRATRAPPAESATSDRAAARAQPIPLTTTQTCPREKKPEKCPVCGIGENPTPGAKPPYLGPPPRRPKDSETIPPLTALQRTRMICLGARVWQGLDGRHFHVDTLHVGQASEIEMYDRRGRHLGAICPHCGAGKPGSQVPGRNLDRCD